MSDKKACEQCGSKEPHTMCKFVKESLQPCDCGEPDSPGTHYTEGPCTYEVKLTRREHSCMCGKECPNEQLEALKTRNEEGEKELSAMETRVAVQQKRIEKGWEREKKLGEYTWHKDGCRAVEECEDEDEGVDNSWCDCGLSELLEARGGE